MQTISTRISKEISSQVISQEPGSSGAITDLKQSLITKKPRISNATEQLVKKK